MTVCTGQPAERCLEGYIQGTLPEFESRSFEEHYFECPVCLAQVEALQAVAIKLGSQPIAAPGKTSGRLMAWPVSVYALGAIAALLILGIALFGLRASRRAAPETVAVNAPHTSVPTQSTTPALVGASAPAVEVASLADFSVPGFEPTHLRGKSENTDFEAGMRAYASHDWQHAAKSLALVPADDEEARAAEFYSGICAMKEGRLATAAASLQRVAAAGDSPQQEAALYYLAQVDLARNDTPAARRDLARTISLHGDFEHRAHAELTKIR